MPETLFVRFEVCLALISVYEFVHLLLAAPAPAPALARRAARPPANGVLLVTFHQTSQHLHLPAVLAGRRIHYTIRFCLQQAVPCRNYPESSLECRSTAHCGKISSNPGLGIHYIVSA